MIISDYTSETPIERKERRHSEDLCNNPERHNPTTDTLEINADVCYRCLPDWINNYIFDVRCYVMRRIKK